MGERPPTLSAAERLSRRGGFSPIDRLGYNTPTDEDVARAIAIIEDSRRTHVEWAEWQEATPDWRSKVEPSSPGEPEHHRRCIAEYDHVLAVLRAPYLGSFTPGGEPS